ncbi:hypothetical protein ACYOEI_42515, partial [Singulisphaera rosea]
NPNCFPRWCGPDDYCRKPLPNLCRPAFPAYGPPPTPVAPYTAELAPPRISTLGFPVPIAR